MATINPIRVWRAFLTALQELREDSTKRDDPKQIVVRNRSEEERAKANLGTRPLEWSGKWARADEMEGATGRTPKPTD